MTITPETLVANIQSKLDWLAGVAALNLENAISRQGKVDAELTQLKTNIEKQKSMPYKWDYGDLTKKEFIPDSGLLAVEKDAKGNPIAFSVKPRTLNTSDAEYMALHDKVVQNITEVAELFYQGFFPVLNDVSDDLDAWIASALRDEKGIDAAVEAQLYQRDKDRVEGEYQKSLSEAETLWASRGFNMPVGMLTGVQFNLRQAADAKHAETSRALVIKQMELRVENAREAAKLAHDARNSAMKTTVDYVNALFNSYDPTTRLVTVQNEMEKQAIERLQQYYKLSMDWETFLKQWSYDKQWETDYELVKRKWQAEDFYNKLDVDNGMELMRAYTTQAAAALNALHTGASMNLGVSL